MLKKIQYNINHQTSCTMNTIIIIGNIENDIFNFRKEVKELQIDWENSYKFSYMCLNNDRVQLTIAYKGSYEYKNTLLMDAYTISDYLEQWTKFETESITLS